MWCCSQVNPWPFWADMRYKWHEVFYYRWACVQCNQSVPINPPAWVASLTITSVKPRNPTATRSTHEEVERMTYHRNWYMVTIGNQFGTNMGICDYAFILWSCRYVTWRSSAKADTLLHQENRGAALARCCCQRFLQIRRSASNCGKAWAMTITRSILFCDVRKKKGKQEVNGHTKVRGKWDILKRICYEDAYVCEAKVKLNFPLLEHVWGYATVQIN